MTDALTPTNPPSEQNMSEAKHTPISMAPTPGPWRVERNAVGFPMVVTGVKEVVTKVICVYGDDGTPQAFSALADSDAHLIAAALDMKAAILASSCPRPANAVPEGVHLTVEDCLERGECGCNMGAAIARATGS